MLSTPRYLLQILITVFVAAVLLQGVLGADAAPSPQGTQPAAFNMEGTFSLNQTSSGCNFSDAPLTTGTISATVDLASGSISARLNGGGNGTQHLTCPGEKTAGTQTWRQQYSAQVSGSVNPASGAVSMTGTLTGSNSVQFSNCTQDGQTMSCPSNYSRPYTFPITLNGTLTTGDRVNYSGSGAFIVNNIPLSTQGTWRATGVAPAVVATTAPLPTATSEPTITATTTQVRPSATIPIPTETPVPTSTPEPTATEVATVAIPTATRIPPPPLDPCMPEQSIAPGRSQVLVRAAAQTQPVPVGCPRPPMVFAVISDEVDRGFVDFIEVDASSITPSSLDAAMNALEAATPFGTQIKQLYFVGHGGAAESIAGRQGAIEIGGQDYGQAEFEALAANRPGLARRFAPGATVTLLNCDVGQDEAFVQAVGEAFLGVNGGLVWAKTGSVSQWNNFLVFGGYYIDTPEDPANATNLAWFLGSGEWRSWVVRPETHFLPRFERFSE